MANGMQVKICGVTAPEHALAAVEEGAAFIGLTFYPGSHRYVTVARAREIADAVHAAAPAQAGGRQPRVTGLFVNEPLEHIRAVAAAVGLDLVQLHGDEPWTMVPEVGLPVIKAVRVAADANPEAVLAGVAQGQPVLAATNSLLLLDAAVIGMFGGTGHRVNVELARTVAARVPLLLAGGLTPDNVAEAIATVQPWGVDVSSGVETGKVKDVAKIRAFVRAALTAV